MAHIALATCYEFSNLFKDEAPLVAALEQRGIKVTPAIWNSPEIDWTAYDAVLIRNTWDYQQQYEAFSAWLDYLEAKQLRVFNPIALLRWNLNKQYLKQLAEVGIRILPTIFATEEKLDLLTVLREQGWIEAVAKPLISASGNHTWKLSPENATDYQQEFDFIQSHFGMMIQPYVPQIGLVGEYSCVFFAGQFSHSVLKTPAENELLVHEERGGTTCPITASPKLIQETENVIQALVQITGITPLYARVDGFLDDENFVLMELECIEPELYFSRFAGAGERFADLLAQVLR